MIIAFLANHVVSRVYICGLAWRVGVALSPRRERKRAKHARRCLLLLRSQQSILIVAFLRRLKWLLCGWPTGLWRRASLLTAVDQILGRKDGCAKYKHRERQRGVCCKVAVMRSRGSFRTSHECQRAEPCGSRPSLRERARW